MASTSQSFAIDKYSFCDVPMSQPEMKPIWNHHSARDHIYLVLDHEGPLEQPSDPRFPYLRRLQVRFCKTEDFKSVMLALKRIGCPVQFYNMESVQPIQPKPSDHEYARSKYSNLIRNTIQYPRPATSRSQLGTAASLVQNRAPLFPQRLGLEATHISNRQSLTPNISSQNHQLPCDEPLDQIISDGYAGLAHQSFPSSPPGQRQHPFSLGSSGNNYLQRNSSFHQNITEQAIPSHNIGSQPQSFVMQNPYDQAFQKHLRQANSATCSATSRPPTGVSLMNPVPVSRGTITSAGTLYGPSSQVSIYQQPNLINLSQQSYIDISASQQLLAADISDGESVPPPRQLPDFDALNKVHGDKLLPSSSAKLTSSFRSTKTGNNGKAPLKRKRQPDDTETTENITDNATQTKKANEKKVSAKKAKVAAAANKAPVTPKPMVATKSKKKAPTKAKASSPVVFTPIQSKTTGGTPILSPARTPLSKKLKAMQPTSASTLNKRQCQAKKYRDTSIPTALDSITMLHNDNEIIDENLLAQLIHSNEHLKMVQRLEKVWGRMGFGLRLRASGMFGEIVESIGNKDQLVPTSATS
ncbi:hypothetical protein H072_3995 [Dactylellina haptotyla CBS 200.50]|uniref:Uncharacterized protein n=1 Tax=Dactylellina haptotyla (strain CBS 200.50) TaxID=1284197 RepID=S8BRE1_DACHA|nr:hypothetical protein H072_3995 [Dactylellina haptotyla CBS 200.50]